MKLLPQSLFGAHRAHPHRRLVDCTWPRRGRVGRHARPSATGRTRAMAAPDRTAQLPLRATKSARRPTNGRRPAPTARRSPRGPHDAGTQAWQLPLRLADGSPLALSLTPPQGGISRGTLWLLLVQQATLALAAWVAVQLTTRPLTRLAEAADALGHSVSAELPEQGPHEVARAGRAFNAMQQRIADHLAERVHTLAAISHDLKIPLTRMRLRAELLPEGSTREKLLSDLEAMQSLVGEGLAYARSTARPS